MINYNNFYKEELLYEFKLCYKKIHSPQPKFYQYEIHIDPTTPFPQHLEEGEIISKKDFYKIIKTTNEFINYQKPHSVLLLGIYLTIFYNLIPSIISINTSNTAIIGVYFLLLFIFTVLILISNSIYRRNYFHYKSFHELNEKFLFKNIRLTFINRFRSFVILYIAFILFLLFIILVFYYIRIDDSKHLKNHSAFYLMIYSIMVYSLVSTLLFIRHTLLFSRFKNIVNSKSSELEHLEYLNNNLESFFKYDPLCVYFIPKTILDHTKENKEDKSQSFVKSDIASMIVKSNL
ncbi:hypothetical protein DICPUDRAFT_74576 [Dictyostelium purpureum]|uniref:Uncharacterized protein n=1 Tax=Dictyostelium purpureum TaxID=5786 RepID=F0Z853_DICPU|nr:uncharacterized protein DICPUDRAFT_74576 [Dictyostelium purpureum]EGC39868.1 hypothetical protein DICPUDRAFT_74576 [Dictyostelium purpureum]|eukprot:XP_003283619.1 hypothetical protein DICPUDRAFT_74576 [Dictyostelium purpureum]